MHHRRIRNLLVWILVTSLAVSWPVPQLTAVEQKAPAVVRRVSVHDPSIIKADGTYYVFGSHLADARSNDLMSWTQMNRDWNFRGGDSWKNDSVYGEILTNLSESFQWAGYNDGDHMTDDSRLGVWAPDVIYNPDYKWSETDRGAYMLYYSTSSTWRRSCIGYAVSKNVEGPYQYVDTLIYSGFTKTGAVDGGGNRNTKWDNDYLNLKELIDQKRISGISDKWFTSDGGWNERYAPNAIDPTVFYGKDNKLYMVYGSWSGGLFILELDRETGDAMYPGNDSTESISGNFTDRYFGTHIAGGNHQSGEGPYILYDTETDYYYLYETYGGLTATGGYNMRMFRSRNVYGPYLDAAGRNAKDSGQNNNNYGIKLIGNYSFTNQPGYRAAGHNSAMVDDDGQRYLFYHQRFNQPGNQTEAHEVRVRRQYMNEDNWPVTAVYEYRGEDISHYDESDVVGKYEIINHGTSSDGNMISSQQIELYADGSIDGDLSGTWAKTTGTGKEYDYITIKLGNAVYKGVLYEQYNEESVSRSVMTFSAIGNDNTCLWGTRTGSLTDIDGSYKDTLIYGYDFDKEPSNPDRINPVSRSEKTGQATLVGTAAIEEDMDRGNVLHIQNEAGAQQVNYFRLPNDTLSTVKSDGFTVSMWVNAGTDVAAPSALFEANRNGQPADAGYPMTRISANLKSHINANGYIDCIPDSETLLTRNQWHHVVYSVNSGEVCTYLDGRQIQSVSKNIAGCFDNANDYSIHKAVNVTVGAGVIWNDVDVRDAKFDNIAVYNKTLTAEEVDTLFTSDASTPFLNDSLIYGFDFESGACGGKIAPVTGSTKKNPAELRGSTSIRTDSVRGSVLAISNPKGVKSNSYLRLPADVLTTVTGDGFTVGMWTNIGSSTFGHSALFEANRSGSRNAWPMTRVSANLIARINANSYSDTDGIGSNEEEKAKPFSSGEWHYVAYSVDTKGIRLYLDGELLQSTTKDLTNCFNSSLNDSIQKAVYTTIGSGRIFDDEDISEAMFDNVAIYNKALSAAQIKQMYRDETEGEDPEPSAEPTRDPENPSETAAPTKDPENPSETTAPTEDPENPSETAAPTEDPENPSETTAPTRDPESPSETTVPTRDPDAPPASDVPGNQITTPPANPVPPAAFKGTVSLAEAGRAVMNANTDKGDPKGSVFAVLRLKGKGGKKSIQLSWTKVKGADGYIVYGSSCGKKMKEIGRVSAGKTGTTIKKLKKGKYYKYIVSAFKNIGGEMRICAQSKSVHVCTSGGKTANPVKVTVKKKLVLKKGKAKKISAVLKPAKKLKIHIAKFRYESTNTKIAAVDKKGRIKAKKKGTCKIYVYAQNGVYKTVKVTVK